MTILEMLLGLGALAIWIFALRQLRLFRRHWIGKPDEDLPKAWSHARNAGVLGAVFLMIVLALALVGVTSGDLGWRG